MVGAILVLATSACSSSDSDDIYGVWITPGNSIYMSFNEDDTWGVSHREDADPIDWGTFTFDGELLTLSTDPDSKNCQDTGTYEAAFTAEGHLELTDIEDPCTRRKVDLRGPRSDIDLPHSTGTLVPYSP